MENQKQKQFASKRKRQFKKNVTKKILKDITDSDSSVYLQLDDSNDSGDLSDLQNVYLAQDYFLYMMQKLR